MASIRATVHTQERECDSEHHWWPEPLTENQHIRIHHALHGKLELVPLAELLTRRTRSFSGKKWSKRRTQKHLAKSYFKLHINISVHCNSNHFEKLPLSHATIFSSFWSTTVSEWMKKINLALFRQVFFCYLIIHSFLYLRKISWVFNCCFWPLNPRGKKK